MGFKSFGRMKNATVPRQESSGASVEAGPSNAKKAVAEKAGQAVAAIGEMGMLGKVKTIGKVVGVLAVIGIGMSAYNAMKKPAGSALVDPITVTSAPAAQGAAAPGAPAAAPGSAAAPAGTVPLAAPEAQLQVSQNAISNDLLERLSKELDTFGTVVAKERQSCSAVASQTMRTMCESMGVDEYFRCFPDGERSDPTAKGCFK